MRDTGWRQPQSQQSQVIPTLLFSINCLLGVQKTWDTWDGKGSALREGENEQALEYAVTHGWNRIGGSDSHIVSHIGRYATRFEDDIKDVEGLVDALENGQFDAIRLDGD